MPDTPAEEKKSLFEKMGAGLPVGLTALATILAGMSTSELSRAMYWRSTAAQDQGKANDQWSLAAHKRDRALMCETTADTLKAVGGYRAVLEPPRTPPPEFVQRIGAWIGGKGEPPSEDGDIRWVLRAIKEGYYSESEIVLFARSVRPGTLYAEIKSALVRAAEVENAYDKELAAVREAASAATGEGKSATIAARYEVDSRRNRAEATANQWVGYLYEVRVKTSTAESDRHRQRSENFFFAMLAAQVGGVGSSLALARKRRSVLWLVAGIGGLVAVGFGAFVYLMM